MNEKIKSYDDLKSKYDQIIGKHRTDAFFKARNTTLNKGGKRRRKTRRYKR